MKNEKKETFDPESLIIHHPEALSPFRKGAEWTLTTIGWLVWFFLVRPVGMVLLWLIGVEIFVEHMINLRGVLALEQLSVIYGAVIVLLYLIIRGWNYYNARSFRGKERRMTTRMVSAQDTCQYFHLPPEAGEKIRQWKEVSVDFKPGHTIIVHKPSAADAHERFTGRFRPT